MKDGLIRLTDEKDIFYDSIERVYRYRMHCPQCGTVSLTCQCYQDLDLLFIDIDDGLADKICSAKCGLLFGEWDDLNEAMQATGMRRKIDEFTNEELKLICAKFDKPVILEAMQDCRIFKHISELTKEDVIIILKHYSADVDEMVEELNISIGKSIKELNEEEASKVLTLLTEDYDGDYPHGEECKL